MPSGRPPRSPGPLRESDDEDPRRNLIPLSDVPRHIAEGAALYNAAKFWHAHEEWEKAWHALRAAGKQEQADYVQALVWVTASFENVSRGKPAGAEQQLTKALGRLRGLAGHGAQLGLRNEASFLAALEDIEGGRVKPSREAAPHLDATG